MADPMIASKSPSGADRAHHSRHRRAWGFQVLVLCIAVAFGILTLLARTMPYFAFDLPLTRSIQAIQEPWLEVLLHAVSWIGYPPQSNLVFGAIILGLFLAGLRLEALMTAFAAVGSAGLWFQLAPLIARPRPTPDLVNVAHQLPFGSFPSGHALNLTAIFGFLLYLTFTQLRAGWLRRVILVVLALPLPTVGLARIHAGAHWPSDVLGGYLLGALWLALTIHLYRWGKQRLSPRHAPGRQRSALSRSTVGALPPPNSSTS